MKNLTAKEIAKVNDRASHAMRALRLAKKARKEGDRKSMRGWAKSFRTWSFLTYCAANPITVFR